MNRIRVLRLAIAALCAAGFFGTVARGFGGAIPVYTTEDWMANDVATLFLLVPVVVVGISLVFYVVADRGMTSAWATGALLLAVSAAFAFVAGSSLSNYDGDGLWVLWIPIFGLPMGVIEFLSWVMQPESAP